MDVACERGVSSWLSALPLHSHGFNLHKRMFRDSLCIRYGWRPPDLPGTCVCGGSFTVTHALSCPYSGYLIHRHNDLRNLTATLLRESCTNVTIEPHLQPLTGEHLDYRTANREDNARLDVAADGFWGISGQRAFFDVRVFNPMAPSLSNLTLHACYTLNEQEKKRLYDQRVSGCGVRFIFSVDLFNCW